MIMSITAEIPRNEWRNFFDRFSSVHEGWPVRVEILGEQSYGLEATGVELEGVIADVRPQGAAISVVLGSDDRLIHSVPDADQVYVTQSEEGADEALYIKSRGGFNTLITFRRPVLPQTLVRTVASSMPHPGHGGS